MTTTSKQYCPWGHDTWLEGRASNGRCRECRRISDRRGYLKSAEEKRAANRRRWIRRGSLYRMARRISSTIDGLDARLQEVIRGSK